MDWSTFPVFLVASLAAGATGIVFKPGPWYDALRKPWFTPPPWAFPVVWTYLYLSVAYAAARTAALPGSQLALALFAAQIALNTLWTPVFFGAHRMGPGMAILVLLWIVVAAMGLAFLSLDTLAGVLVLPYVVWLSVAAALNWRIWRDNPEA